MHNRLRRRGGLPRPFGCFMLILGATLWIPSAIRVGVGAASQRPMGVMPLVVVTGLLIALVVGRWGGRWALRRVRYTARMQRCIQWWQEVSR